MPGGIRLRELFESLLVVWVETESQGCSNPRLELANAFRVLWAENP
jgi:hypothetical protein